MLAVPHDLGHVGGGSSVAAWALQALASRHEVSILTWRDVDLATANRSFGTSLRREDFRWYSVAPGVRRVLSLLPLPLAHLKNQILYRQARDLHARERFDVVFGLMNEIDVGETALQYVHFPWRYWPRPQADLRWYHVEPLVRAYRRLSAQLAGYDCQRVARNVTVANSDWTARCFEQCYGVRPPTLYPPVVGGFPHAPLEERSRSFNCLGRIAPEKRLVEIIEILAAVRSRGHDVGLRIIGHVDSRTYMRRVAEAAAPHRDWVSFHLGLERDEMAELVVRSRYAIHGMIDEHFGIGPAELQRAGCITFVPHRGGSCEIADGDERVVYRNADDAVNKIDRVLRDPGLERRLQLAVELRQDKFSEQRFVREISALVDSFASDAARGGAAGARASR